jgi:predicted transcriptional regulator
MTTKISITLDDEVRRFVDTVAIKNRSHFINQVLRQEQQRLFLEELGAAYAEESADPEFQAEFELWDVTIAGGLT